MKRVLSFRSRCSAGAGCLKNLNVKELLSILKNINTPFSLNSTDFDALIALSKSTTYLIVVSIFLDLVVYSSIISATIS